MPGGVAGPGTGWGWGRQQVLGKALGAWHKRGRAGCRQGKGHTAGRCLGHPVPSNQRTVPTSLSPPTSTLACLMPCLKILLPKKVEYHTIIHLSPSGSMHRRMVEEKVLGGKFGRDVCVAQRVEKVSPVPWRFLSPKLGRW